MASNTANQITILQNLQTLVNSIETNAANWRCGDPTIDAISIGLLTTRLDQVMQYLLNNGSRAQQAAISQARAANTNVGAGNSADFVYRIADDYMTALSKQITNLQNPTATPRRQHTAGQ